MEQIYQIGNLSAIDLSKLQSVGEMNFYFDSGTPEMTLYFEYNTQILVKFHGFSNEKAEQERNDLIQSWRDSKI